METYAFLDGGSNTSFITEPLLKMLAVKGSKTTLSLTTMGKEGNKVESSVISLEVSDSNGQNVVEIPAAFSVANLPVSKEDIPRQSDVDRWPHLQGVVLRDIDSEVGLLIGNDVLIALQPKEVKESDSGGPYATRTSWGWTVNGPLGRNGHQNATTTFIRSDELEKSFREFCNREFDDVEDEAKRAKLKDDHYEIALPWKSSNPALPKNKSLAVRRLMLLKRRLSNGKDLFQKYSAFIDDLLQKGYARKLTERERNEQSHITCNCLITQFFTRKSRMCSRIWWHVIKQGVVTGAGSN